MKVIDQCILERYQASFRDTLKSHFKDDLEFLFIALHPNEFYTFVESSIEYDGEICVDAETLVNGITPIATRENLSKILRCNLDHDAHVVTLQQNKGESSEVILGIVVFWDASQLNSRIQTFASQLSESLYRHYCNYLIKWHRSAQKTLCSTSESILRNAAWFEAVEPSDAFPQSRNLLTSKSGSADLRKKIAKRAIRMLVKGLQLDRCAVLTPLDEAPDFWFYLEHSGFPDEVVERKNYYVRGQGMTGRVLLLRRGDSPIQSSDLESDERWSKRGSQLLRNKGEIGRLAYIGIPIFSHVSKADVLPYGAIVCCRFQNEQRHINAFTKREELHLRNIATQLSYGFDVLRWREDDEKRLIRQLQLSRIWAGNGSLQSKLAKSILILEDEGPFRRILLSQLSDDGQYMVGKAACGFRNALVRETRRRVYSTAPKNSSDEDVLARVVRLGVTSPFEVDPFNPSDEWYPHINRYAAEVNGVRHKLMLIPLVDQESRVFGVVLAEYPEHILRVPPEQIQRLAAYAAHLATLMQLNAAKVAAHRERDTVEKTLCLSEARSSNVELLRDLILIACKSFECTAGLAYLFEHESHLLRGMASIGLNEVVVKATSYSIDISSETSYADDSFAERVFRLRVPLFQRLAGDAPVDQEDCTSVGISPRASLLGIPLTLGDECYGVIVLVNELNVNPLSTHSATIANFARAAALSISRDEFLSSKQSIDTMQDANEVFVQQIGRIGEDAESDDSLRQLVAGSSRHLELFLREAGRLLQSRMCAIFTPDAPVEIHLNANRTRGERIVPGGVKFYYRAGKGYESLPVHGGKYFYSDNVKGLTSTVLRTLETQSSRNVQRDPRWSEYLKNDVVQAFKDCDGLRAWIGTPILFSEGSRQYLYGVLTFTRARMHARDTLFYGETDHSAAERLAWMLAVGFHSQQSVRRMYDSLKSQLRSFLHSVRTPLDLVQNDRVSSIRDFAEGLPGIQHLCDMIDKDLQFVNAGFTAFTDFTKDDPEWEDFLPTVKLADIAQIVIHVTKCKSSFVNLLPPAISPPDCSCRIDDSRLIYILHTLIENGAKAVRECGKKGTVSTNLECNENLLHISVKDSGIGLAPNVERRMFDEFYSGFQHSSSGLGLTLLKRFVDADKNGSIDWTSVPGEGTEFKITLSVNKSTSASK